MVSQKNLSHSSLIWSVAPPRRLVVWRRVELVCFLALGFRASSLFEVMAARGGLVGGDGRPEIGTSGIPLGPCSHGSAVVHALQRGRRVDEVATGEDIGLARHSLAVATT
jgi:hypothetical protein